MAYKVAILIISLAAFLPQLFSFPLQNWDEAWYGEIIKNMASGNYSLLVPFWNGNYYLDKPPLYFWLSLPVVKFFGIGEWQVRLVSVLAGIISVYLVFLIGEKLISRRVGLFAGVIFLTLGQIIERLGNGNLDALLICLALASFYFYLDSYKSWKYTFLTGLFLGLTYFAKGWVLGLYPLFLMFVHTFLYRRKFLNLLLILAISVFILSWWFITGFHTFGKKFLDWYLFSPTAGSFGGHLDFSFTLLRTFFRDLGFWLFILLFFQISRKNVGQMEKRMVLFLLLTSLVYVLAMNFQSNKLGWYLLPSYPLIALVVAYCLDRLLDTYFKFMIFLSIFVFLAQSLLLMKIKISDTDRSQVGATLGKYAKTIIPKGASLILDDPDYPSFLFYSDLGKVYTTSYFGGDEREWWILKDENLKSFIQKNPKTWLVSRDPESLPVDLEGSQLVTRFNGYQFVRLY